MSSRDKSWWKCRTSSSTVPRSNPAIRGALEWNIPTEGTLPFDYSQHKKIDAIFSWIADDRLNVKPMLTHILRPEEIKIAYGAAREKERFVGGDFEWR